MSELKDNLDLILQEKTNKITSQNLKKDVKVFDITGSYDKEDIKELQDKLEESKEELKSVKRDIENSSAEVKGLGKNVTLNNTADGARFKKPPLPEGNTVQDGEPTPETPIPIQNVVGNVEIKIQNKNLFGVSFQRGYWKTDGTYTAMTENTTTMSTPKFKLKAGSYIISNSKITSWQWYIINWTDGNYSVIQKYSTKTFKLTRDSILSFQFNTPKGTGVAVEPYLEELTEYMMLEQGTTATSYVAHEEQNYPFTFAEGQRGMQGTTLEDDGIHQKRARVVLDGTESWLEQVLTTNTASYLLNMGSNVKLSNTLPLGYLSNYFKAHSGPSWSADIPRLVQMNDKRFRFGINKDELSEISANGFKAWLATKYANGTPVIFEYELEKEEIIPYNSTQQAQYNAIKQARSYEEQTNISSNTIALFNVIAYEDMDKKINNLENRVELLS